MNLHSDSTSNMKVVFRRINKLGCHSQVNNANKQSKGVEKEASKINHGMFLFAVALAALLHQVPRCVGKETPDENSDCKNVTLEAKVIAMDYSGDLLAPEKLSKQICEDLVKIRHKFSDVANLTYRGQWYPGEIITDVTLSAEQKQKINESEYGPLLYVGQSENYNITLLIFSSLFNSEKLAALVKTRFGIECQAFHRRTPVLVMYHEESKRQKHQEANEKHIRKYTFEKRSGGCHHEPTLCKKRHFWVFLVSEKDDVVLENEYDAPANIYALAK